MKLLDPFAGYRLASGNALFHIALFTGSFWVVNFGIDLHYSNNSIKHAFEMLRWGHFILVVLDFLEKLISRPSSIPPTPKREEEELEAPMTEE